MTGDDDVVEVIRVALLKLSNSELKAKLRQSRCRYPSSANRQELVKLCLQILLDENSPLDRDAEEDDCDGDHVYDELEIDREIEITEQGHITAGTRDAYEKYQRRMYVWWASKTGVSMKRVGEAVASRRG